MKMKLAIMKSRLAIMKMKAAIRDSVQHTAS